MANAPTNRHDIILLHLDGVDDPEESLARGVQRAMAAFGRMQDAPTSHVRLPHGAMRPRDAPVDLGPVAPPE